MTRDAAQPLRDAAQLGMRPNPASQIIRFIEAPGTRDGTGREPDPAFSISYEPLPWHHLLIVLAPLSMADNRDIWWPILVTPNLVNVTVI